MPLKLAAHTIEINNLLGNGKTRDDLYKMYDYFIDKYGLSMLEHIYQRHVRKQIGKLKKAAFRKEAAAGRVFEQKRDPSIPDTNHKNKSSYRETVNKDGDNEIHLTSESTNISKIDELIEKYKIDLNKWELVDKEISERTIPALYRDQNLTWDDGVMSGHAIRKPEYVTITVTNIKAKFKYRKEEIIASQIIAEQIEDMQNYSPKFYNIPELIIPSGNEFVFEVPPFDIHFGQLSWHEETGKNYDTKIAKRMLLNGVMRQLQNVKGYNLSFITLPIGNDLFNVDNQNNTTTKGIIQDEDCREPKTFRMARELIVEIADMCSTVAPTKILIVPGNHEYNRLFHLGDSLQCWYRNSNTVSVDNRPLNRKYYDYGLNLVGYTHGDATPRQRLRSLIVEENGMAYAKSRFREYHTGHIHHEVVIDIDGVIFRSLPTLVIPSKWVKFKGFLGLRNFPCFLRHKTQGLIAQFNWFDM